MLRQFAAALDGCVINRYHPKERTITDRIDVKYMYAPKQKVIEDMVNKAATLSLPVVAYNMTSLARDTKRVFNKIHGFDIPQGSTDTETTPHSDFIPPPVPVNISLDVSILAKFQRDLDQILQNFIVYSNPYFIVSWQMPEGLMTRYSEIRSKIIWSGQVAITTPVDITAEKTSHIRADTQFTIEGWLFPAKFGDTSNIYFIQENLIPVANIETCNR